MATDVVVIGAGVMGASIAWELARRGRRVTVVDKAGGAGHGSTSASSAVVRFNFSTLAGVTAAWEAQFGWRSWPEHLGHDVGEPARFVRCGIALLDVDIMPRQAFLPLFAKVGVPFEEWSDTQLRERIPGIDVGRYWPPKRIDDEGFWRETEGTLGAVYTPDAGFVSDPQLAAQNLADAARAHGAEFRFHATVSHIERTNDRVTAVTLADGTRLPCAVVVNAAGPWSGRINELAGVGADFTVRSRPLRQEVAHMPAPPGGLGIAVADLDLGTYLRGDTGGGLLIGGTEPDCDPLQWIEDPDALTQHPTMAVFEAQVTRAARRFPELTIPNRARGVAGVYDVTDDWTPVYDRTDLDGFYVAMGTSGNQFKNAPVVGGFLAAIIEHTERGADHDERPARYVGEHTGLEIDLSAFSRKRPLTAGNSGTVLG
ncbi:FAD-binding oxidoreductase [Amycolatopsis sp. EV170708-02-1]|uniref:NAD(P)/FAD-dependent oxidoreductase n=1 Tax=Amycolatopsis sp. EV170708-02-1 TaxID=2919322 RepID=UPI001F0B88EB|nr:FAD-dependent oxidoreductase [Amycolatopsis sp. EV170708-02-1]UMP00070.1 FAD-binding oxidoreductase [Amycolatopsis sp. EV170708-02-1]